MEQGMEAVGVDFNQLVKLLVTALPEVNVNLLSLNRSEMDQLNAALDDEEKLKTLLCQAREHQPNLLWVCLHV